MNSLISRLDAPVSRLDDRLENVWKFGPIYKQHKKIFSWIGAGVSAYFGLKIASWFLIQAFKLPPVDLNKRYGKGSWAVVTKASSPVGKAFCHALAQKGFNIVLIGKNDNKLQEIALEVSNAQNGKIETRVIVADFGDCLKEGFFETIYMQLQDLDISVLVNNFIVDIGKQRLVETSEAQLKYMVMANTVPTALMIRTLVGKLRSRTENSKHKSAVITLSSHAASMPLPYRAAYGSTSVFNDFISRGLAIEYAGQKIDWLSYRVPLKSKKDYKGASLRSADCVKACLASLGKEHYTNGSWKYRFQAQKLSLPWLFPGEIQIDDRNSSGFEPQRVATSSSS